MSDELKPCPFCGGEKLLIVGCEYDPDLISVECQHYDCSFTKNGKTTKELAIASWNTRTPNTEALEALDSLFHYHGYTSWHVKPEKSQKVWESLQTIRKALSGGEG